MRERSQILMYHSIGGKADGDARGLYSVSPADFARQMNHLKELQVNGVTEIVPFGHDAPGSISISFDDGYLDNLTVAAPILQEFAFPFHVFVNPSFVDSNREEFLTRIQVSELASLPLATLGIHGFTHTPLTELSSDGVRGEIQVALEWLKERTNRQADSLSYPHGAVNASVIKEVRASGIKRAACSRFSALDTNQDHFRLPRIDIWSTDTLEIFDAKIRGYWDWMRWRT